MCSDTQGLMPHPRAPQLSPGSFTHNVGPRSPGSLSSTGATELGFVQKSPTSPNQECKGGLTCSVLQGQGQQVSAFLPDTGSQGSSSVWSTSSHA